MDNREALVKQVRLIDETHRILRIWDKYNALLKLLYSLNIQAEDRMSFNEMEAYDKRRTEEFWSKENS